jgi:hypothetical protein
MKVGDKVRVVGVPERLPENDIETKRLFQLCLGRTFVIHSLKEIEGLPYNLVELLVGEVVGKADYMHSIYIDPEFLDLVAIAD